MVVSTSVTSGGVWLRRKMRTALTAGSELPAASTAVTAAKYSWSGNKPENTLDLAPALPPPLAESPATEVNVWSSRKYRNPLRSTGAW